ncbi:uncharacterized protein LOC120898899 isoform X1 [Anopheles arabiensis]|uniref:EGF-like domain-containing protein n=1 Tax=Anopheles arabiensis TaxID=7173 RepID=A0A182IDF1_ANOAR|nr:uncharacterized protein LOC4576922 isoform X1 [Anopheles gambiae]XP_040161333.1 uncharacterized protein LOC120898899 isoform X1 [Anopheles arabiensis]
MDTTKIAYLMLAVCFSWLPALSGTTTTNPFHAALTDNLTQCGAVVCVAETEVCREDSFCECKPHFEDQGSFQCVPCPAEGQYCRGCCISDALTCYHGVCRRCSLDSNGNCISQESLFFLTAAQVALATAMVLGVISLSFLLYKTLRNRLRRNNQVLESEFRQSVVSRVSLSSIQQRVIRRLRDRPPKYETRHNYEYQQRQTERQISQQSSSVEPDRQSNPAPVGGPPPAYDGDTISLAENPPPYTQEQTDRTSSGIAVIDIPTTTTTDHALSMDLPTDRTSSNLQGITNHAFEPDKLTSSQPQIIQPSDNGETNGRPKEECYDIPLVNSNDKTVYM